MKNILLVSLLFISLLSCQEHELANPEFSGVSVCGVSDPLKELPWLNASIQEATLPTDFCALWQVIQGDYAGKTVYIVVVSGAACCTCGNAVYDCEGEVVFVCDAKEESKIRNKKVIWKRA